jgi:hypothetical protein
MYNSSTKITMLRKIKKNKPGSERHISRFISYLESRTCVYNMNVWVWTQDFAVGKQVLYRFSHTSILLMYFNYLFNKYVQIMKYWC